MTDRARAFRLAAWVGIAMLLIATVLLAVLPTKAGPLGPGFRTPIIAFELARSSSEIESLFAAPASAQRAELVRAMDLGNEIDFAFMVAYGGFLALFGLAVARDRGGRFHIATVLGPLAALFDVCENVQLLAITKALGGDYSGALSRLVVFTWLKWETLGVAMLLLAPWLARGDRACRVVAALCLSSSLVGFAAIFARGAVAEAFSALLSLAFLGLVVVAFRAGRAATAMP